MFSEIEKKRAAAGIDQKTLCARAEVHETTYTARKSGRRTLSEKTLKKLDDALSALIEEKAAALEEMREGTASS